MNVRGLDDTIKWYNKHAEKYSKRASGVTFEETAAYFLSKLSPKAHILDAGCGDGRDSQTLTEMGASVTGLDLSEGLITVAKQRNILAKFIQGSFLEIPAPDESFDGIWSHASLVHLETAADVEKALSEFARVLKPSGQLYILVKQQNGQEKIAVVSDSLSNHDRFFRYYENQELCRFLENAGFSVDQIENEPDIHGRKEVSWIKVFAHKT